MTGRDSEDVLVTSTYLTWKLSQPRNRRIVDVYFIGHTAHPLALAQIAGAGCWVPLSFGLRPLLNDLDHDAMRLTILIMTHTAERSFRTDVYSSRLEPLFQSVASVTANTLARHIRQGRECRLQLAGLTALIWLLLGSTGLARRLADWVPRPALLGVILGLGFGFMLEGIRMIATSPWLGGALLLMALVLLSRPTVVGHLLFGLFVDGFWSALACRALSGIGWAGTYMTGLKLLADRVDAKMMSRATAGHAASICLSGALSFATGDWLARLAGWQSAFLAASISALAAWIIIAVVVPRQQTAVTKQTNGYGLYAKPFGDGLCNGVRHSHA